MLLFSESKMVNYLLQSKAVRNQRTLRRNACARLQWWYLFCLPVVAFAAEETLNSSVACEPGCLNNSTCRINPAFQEPSCVCPEADPVTGQYFRGASCQTQAVKCSDSWWCENGGVCLDVLGDRGEQKAFNCSCPAGFQGPKCQNPVAICEDGLWCANGGTCEPNLSSNGTICKCPSTHMGVNCQTLIEPQELESAESPAVRGLDSENPIGAGIQENLAVTEEQSKYFHLFFWIMGALLLVWASALVFVHRQEIMLLRKGKLGHIKMEPRSLKTAEPLMSSGDVEDPPGFGAPGALSKAAPSQHSKTHPTNKMNNNKGALELVPAFNGSLEDEIKKSGQH